MARSSPRQCSPRHCLPGHCLPGLRFALCLAAFTAFTALSLTSLAFPAKAQSNGAQSNGGQSNGAKADVTQISNIAGDERVEFYTTAAWLETGSGTWNVPIHGRVFRPERSVVRKAALAQILKQGYGVVPHRDARIRFDERIDMLLADNKGGRRIVVSIAGRRHALPPSMADGHFGGIVKLRADAIAPDVEKGRLRYTAELSDRDPRLFAGLVLLLQPEGRSVISDIDDTIKITHVTDRRRMFEATFAKPFEPVPGMARVYQTWAAEGASFHFVSSTPWHLHEPIAEFLKTGGFPDATLVMKKIRLKDSSIMNILADATETKPPEIAGLLKTYPGRTFVLIGDSGEKDPEIYADFMRRHPAQIEAIHIRNVTGAKRDDARFSKAFEGLDAARWSLFAEPTELPRLRQ